jgi:hypothetical protein
MTPENWRTIPAHPAADIFPMMSQAELDELEADIKANRLRFPLMLDAAGETLLDGRNRRRACEIAGVEPRCDRLHEGEDPVDYIVSVNIARRHLSAGQRAMALAMIRPTPERGKRTDLLSDLNKSKERFDFSRTLLSRARKV